MKRKRPLQDGWVCPNCGQTLTRHGRGGARGCKLETQGPTCAGLVCQCTDGRCFSKDTGYGWRRSPCPNAFCQHCGWKGTIRSKEFERAYGSSRCPKALTGWHFTRIRIDKDKTRSDMCLLIFECQLCGAKGFVMIDPIQDIEWRLPEQKAPIAEAASKTQGGDSPGQPATAKALPQE